MDWLSLLFGAVVGVSLGLTGSGGAILAVPLLVYGLSVPPQQAVGISLAAVGIAALIGFLQRWPARQVEIRTGAIFATTGMVGAPAGAWLAHRLPESLLLLMFAGLMVLVAARMWQASKGGGSAPASAAIDAPGADFSACQRDSTGRLLLSSRCAVVLMLLGVMTGVLSGLFGVGGGFVIVPALVLFSGIPIHQAVGTSLLVITLISLAGTAMHLLSGRVIPVPIAGWFIGGSVVGMIAGTRAAGLLRQAVLQRVFAVAIVLVAALTIFRTIAAGRETGSPPPASAAVRNSPVHPELATARL
ncbi:MAG: sulfite exporter TauE/SafE family protein [Phycisphaerae bacterium]|nr:sulfite exporter TauE/SafE family protein [Phycisphaerae bacterium]MDW8262955.1 sulfite exporter TauE/SafE family protein [Phycisphaerales bacterium]